MTTATTTPAADLTPNETLALESLRRHQEGEWSADAAGSWCGVYLDNAKPAGWSGHTWAAVLGSLKEKGLYRVGDGYAWGVVLVPVPTVGNDATEHEPGRFCTEASDLGLAPGVRPRTIATTLGNGQPFVYDRRDGDGSMHYRQQAGTITLTVFND